ncbi:unnamed protein product [Adineta ricciae]|uniref:Metalloendopeptidase n=1 Tax=Adineta ricciae TaxID=249248 RepID=A0A815VKL2_ADIRI|nr:unnamed protein product [Adineta ricciae]
MMKYLTTFLLIVTFDKTFVNAVPASETKRFTNPEEMGGHYQGDMVVPKDAPRGAASRPSWQRWPNGVIPYDMTSSILSNHSALIVDAMGRMEDLTKVNNRMCIQFRPKTDADPIFITIKNGTGCSAHVGYLQNFTLNRTLTLMYAPPYTCMITGIIQHELLHILGFFHEQSRPDRDDYVSIQWENIINGLFNHNEDDIDTLGLPYDYGSVMHYEANAFTSNGQPTIISKRNLTTPLGQRVGMSSIDIAEVQRYYGCLLAPTTLSSSTLIRPTTTKSASLNLIASISPDASRSSHALKIWFTLKEHGTIKLGLKIAGKCQQAQHLVSLVVKYADEGKKSPQVSAIGFGLMGLLKISETTRSDEKRFKILDRNIELGCAYFNAADNYGDN